MQIDYVGRNVQITDDIRSYTESKMERATRFLEAPVDIRLTLEVEGHRQIAEIQIHHRFGDLHAEEESEELLDAIHEVIEKIEKQARRGRKKFLDQRRRGGRKLSQEWPVEVVSKESVGTERTPRVIKTSSLSIKPMSLDEAALRLESAKNDFLVFRDSDHGRVNVLYKRRDGDYGLVTPEA